MNWLSSVQHCLQPMVRLSSPLLMSSTSTQVIVVPQYMHFSLSVIIVLFQTCILLVIFTPVYPCTESTSFVLFKLVFHYSSSPTIIPVIAAILINKNIIVNSIPSITTVLSALLLSL